MFIDWTINLVFLNIIGLFFSQDINLCTWNWCSNPFSPVFGSVLAILWTVIRTFAVSIWVFPQVIHSNIASLIKIYWSCKYYNTIIYSARLYLVYIYMWVILIIVKVNEENNLDFCYYENVMTSYWRKCMKITQIVCEKSLQDILIDWHIKFILFCK